MRLKADRKALLAGFQAASGVVNAKHLCTALRNVRLTAAGEMVSLAATDGEVSVLLSVPAEVGRGDITLIPAARSIAILKELPDDTVTIETVDEHVRITGAHSEFLLPVEDAGAFPSVADFPDGECISIPANVLKGMLRRTMFATDASWTRYALGGVLLEVEGERLRAVATDTRRLSVATGACTLSDAFEPQEDRRTIVPLKAVSLIEKSLPDTDDGVLIAFEKNSISVQTPDAVIHSRLLEGRFPQWERVVPDGHSYDFETVAGVAEVSFRQASLLTSPESRGVDMSLSNGMLTLRSQTAEVGQSRIEMTLAYLGEPLTVTIDPRFVLDFLKVLGDESVVRFEANDKASAVVFKCGNDYTYVVMPLSRE